MRPNEKAKAGAIFAAGAIFKAGGISAAGAGFLELLLGAVCVGASLKAVFLEASLKTVCVGATLKHLESESLVFTMLDFEEYFEGLFLSEQLWEQTGAG